MTEQALNRDKRLADIKKAAELKEKERKAKWLLDAKSDHEERKMLKEYEL